MSEIWTELLSTALLGTAKRPVSLAVDGSPLGSLLSQLEAAEPERRLLGAVASLSLYRQAGRQPAGQTAVRPAVCPDEEQPICSPAAALRLSMMLQGEHRGMLAEWLTALAASGQRVPPDRLPALLDYGRGGLYEQGLIQPVIGQRGRWLASLNPNWQSQAATDIAEEETLWQTGDRPTRRMLLWRLRRRDPERARLLLEQTWRSETAEDREAFLAALEAGLSLADEPFLEAALDDRRKDVRQQAVDLLALLPESGLVRRMSERLAPLLKLAIVSDEAAATSKGSSLLKLVFGKGKTATNDKGSAGRLSLRLPTECDKAMVRDGIEPKPPQYGGIGEKSWWLQQMLAVVPPRHWSDQWQLTPAQLVELAGRTNGKTALLAGWSQATARHRDSGWAAALIRAGQANRSELAAVMPPAARERLVLELFNEVSGPLDSAHPALEILDGCEHAWSPEFSRAVLTRARQEVADNASKRNDYNWHLSQVLAKAGRYLSLSLAAEVAQGWPTGAEFYSRWSDSIESMITVLQFRHAMLEEINA